MTDTEWKLLENHELFSDRNTVQEAMKYIDDIFEQIPTEGGDRMVAYTGAYLLYNTVVKHYNKQIMSIPAFAKSFSEKHDKENYCVY